MRTILAIAIAIHQRPQSLQLVLIIGAVGIYIHLIEGDVIGMLADQDTGDWIIGVRATLAEGAHIISHQSLLGPQSTVCQPG